MSLKTYSEKRHFDRTPEPAPSEKHAKHGPALSFCVQRHHATHLHYDFRLEVDGALKSWAVPKGPTLDPAVKRLAMMVEDHPLEYGSFEGVIPQGNYGAGSVMLWDRGTYEVLGEASAEEQIARGDFKFRLAGEKLKGEFAIVKIKRAGKGNEWLLIKKKDDAAQAGWDTEDYAESVATGRTQEEIARGLGKGGAATWDSDRGQRSEGRGQEERIADRGQATGDSGARAEDRGQKSGRARKSAVKGPERRSKKSLSANGKALAAANGSTATIVERAHKADPMPRDVAPMLAQLGKGDPPASEDWLYEIKWDGVRAMCYIENGKVRMVSRNGNVIDKQYPELTILPHHVKADSAIVDGEIAALDARGVPSFELLQSRINVSEASAIALLSRKTPVVFFAFDLLCLDGRDLRGTPLAERKKLLEEVLEPNEMIHLSNYFAGHGRELLEAAKQQGLEGIVGKRAGSFYESRRTSDWVKWKVTASASFVLCGFTKGEREFFGALVLGVYDRGKLKWAGNVGTGFDRKMMATIHGKLAPLETDKRPVEPDKNLPREVTWVRPELVCEVKFSNWTEDGRLRAPVFVGLRPDIDPAECVREQTEAVAAEELTHDSKSGDPKSGHAKSHDAKSGSHKSHEPKSDDAKADDVTKHSRHPNHGALLDASTTEKMVEIDGRKLKFTNLNKVFYPKDGYNKRDLLNYYDAVAPLIVPHLKDRPLSLKRYPNGIDQPYFFQKEAAESFPKWLRIEKAPDGIHYVIGEDRATLLYLVNLGCIDHNPWMSRVGSYHHPDYVLFDLDPFECAYTKIVEAALLVRKLLDKAELESFPKTTGGDGLHVFVPLAPEYSYEQVRTFAQLIAELAGAERPDLFTTPRSVSKRQKDRVYFDWAQIAEGKTISSPYSARPHPGAPVSTPLAWREVTPKLRPEQFTIANAPARFDRLGDLFQGVLDRRQGLEGAVEKLSGR